MNPSVCVATAALSPAVKHALAAQDRPADLIVDGNGSLRDAAARALATDASWLWVLDGSAAPRPGALLALLTALERVDGPPGPVLLAGVVMTADEEVDSRLAPWSRALPAEKVMAAAGRRLFPIRAAVGSVLVDRGGIERGSAPRPELQPSSALLEWTARLLRRREGYWVAESESETLAGAANPAGDPRLVATLLTGGAFGPREGLRLIAQLAADRRRSSAR